jgi:hypothetical protein
VEERRQNIMKTQTEKRIKHRQLAEERTERAKSNLEEQERKSSMRNKEIEKKIENSNTVLQQKQDRWGKELELKNELQRLKEEEIMSNAERKKRIA